MSSSRCRIFYSEMIGVLPIKCGGLCGISYGGIVVVSSIKYRLSNGEMLDVSPKKYRVS